MTPSVLSNSGRGCTKNPKVWEVCGHGVLCKFLFLLLSTIVDSPRNHENIALKRKMLGLEWFSMFRTSVIPNLIIASQKWCYFIMNSFSILCLEFSKITTKYHSTFLSSVYWRYLLWFCIAQDIALVICVFLLVSALGIKPFVAIYSCPKISVILVFWGVKHF